MSLCSPGDQRNKKEVRSPLIEEFGNPLDQNKLLCYNRFWPEDISRKAHETKNWPSAHLSNFYRGRPVNIYIHEILYITYMNT